MKQKEYQVITKKVKQANYAREYNNGKERNKRREKTVNMVQKN